MKWLLCVDATVIAEADSQEELERLLDEYVKEDGNLEVTIGDNKFDVPREYISIMREDEFDIL